VFILTAVSAPVQPSIEYRQLEGLVDFLKKEKAEKALPVARNEAEETPSEDPAAWDGRFEVALSVFIRQYLASAPPPPRATLAQDARESALHLEHRGRDRLREAGARRLCAVR